ncbi:MAG: [FeFe] hydrogenase H-cluster maturation GTPase HydF [Bacteroidetes bacterium]|nr:[FeFe] hydrogenase H-cluster maturation GTPase HydF [Bacteroidota bacterium]
MSKGTDLKPHIGIFGRRNNGKSSFINAIIGQEVAIVSDQSGTTTDPVKKSVEIFGVGPVVMIDTAGIDDTGELGSKRVAKTREVIKTIDLAILIIAKNTFGDDEVELLNEFKAFNIPAIIIHNKADIEELDFDTLDRIKFFLNSEVLDFSAIDKENKEKVIEAIKRNIPKTAYQKPSLFKGILKPKDVVLLVTPIDSEAPDGRMILPQVMAWRDVLDKDCICMSVKETELEYFMKLGIKPALAVTDSQVFDYVNSVLPAEIPLTSFSILFARLKGDLDVYIKGTNQIDKLQNEDKILILESCTHQLSCEDIGRFKIPVWLEKHTGKKLHYEFRSGLNASLEDLTEYALVIQCGGCVATRKQVLNRLQIVSGKNIPITNYGMLIAYVNGIFERVIQPFYQDET